MFFGIPQPTPYDLHWRMFGIDVRVHPFFWLMDIVLGWSWFNVGGFPLLLLWMFSVFISVLLHELGHVTMGRVFGSEGHILLYSFGGLAIGSSDLRRRWQRILVLFAGVMAQLMLYALVKAFEILVFPAVAQGMSERAILMLYYFIDMLLWINLAWVILNLLPIFPLDGGQISRELLVGWLGQRGLLGSLAISFAVSAALALSVLLQGAGIDLIPFIHFGGGMYTVILFGLLAFSSFQMLQAEMNRGQRWRNEERMPWE